MGKEIEYDEELKMNVDFYRRQGYSDGQIATLIATLLKNKGYNEEIVDKIISKPKSKFTGTAITQAKGRKLDLKSILIGLVVVGMIALAIWIIGVVFFGAPGLGTYVQQAVETMSNLG
jgi:hypothetical protein